MWSRIPTVFPWLRVGRLIIGGVEQTFQGLQGINSQGGNYNLALTDYNKLVVLTGSGGNTFTLLAASAGKGPGSTIYFENDSSGNLTIARAGSDTIASGGATNLTSIVLGPGDRGFLVSDDSSIWRWFGTRHYDSGQQTITAGGSVALTHGLGVQPFIVNYFLHCTTAQGGYSPGDEVQTSVSMAGGGGTNQGVSALASSTNLNIYYGSAGSGANLSIVTKGGGALFTITFADWAFIARASVIN
jgi:hypothetical protein